MTSPGQEVARRAIRLVERVDQEFFAALDGNIAHFTRELRALLRADEPAARDS